MKNNTTNILVYLKDQFGEFKGNESTGEYRFNCPYCQKRGHFHVNIYKGLYLCVTPGCDQRGKLSNFGLSIETKIFNHEINWDLNKKVYGFIYEINNLRDFQCKWIDKRGITIGDNPFNNEMKFVSTDSILPQLKLVFTNQQLEEVGLIKRIHDTHKYVANPVIYPNRLLFFYFSPFCTIDDYKDNILLVRSRYVGNTSDMKYSSPNGEASKYASWGWESINTDTIIVTEGEIKAQIAKQMSLPVVGLPGMSSGHESFKDTCISKDIKKVYICFDSESGIISETNTTKQAAVDRAASRLENLLRKSKIETEIIKLPLLGKTKMDLDTYLLMGNYDNFMELLNV